MSRILTVFGATGNQGSSVVQHVNRLLPGTFRIRAPTRDTNSDKAKKLASQHANVELTQCDINSILDVNRAMEGAHAVFAMTNFWQPEVLKKHDIELKQGRNMVDAAVKAGVQYFIWSSLPDAKAESNGRLLVPHFSQKHDIEEYARSQPSLKSIFFYPSFFMQNVLRSLKKAETGDGIILPLPLPVTTKVAMFDVTDTGKIVARILTSPDQYVGHDIGSAADELTGPEMATIVEQCIGKKTTFVAVSAEEFKKTAPPAVFEEQMSMYKWFTEFGYYGGKVDPWTGRNITGTDMHTLRQFIEASNFTGPQ